MRDQLLELQLDIEQNRLQMVYTVEKGSLR